MNKNFYPGLLFLMFVSASMLCQERTDEREYSYLYPVAYSKDAVLVLWQKDADTTELYAWDMATGRAEKQLCSLFTPAGVTMLPSGTAYSFIDNGRIRIKELIKRSPASIAFERPIYNISLVHWLDDYWGYCHAQEQLGRFGVYRFNRDGDVQCMIQHPSADFLFPSRGNDRMFYIYRSLQNNQLVHSIGSVPCDDGKYSMQDQEFAISSGSLALAFLRMESDTRGFVIGHSRMADDASEAVPLYYYKIEHYNGAWHADLLFTFKVPTMLINASNCHRLHENLLPLLPLHDGDTIYYSSANQTKIMRPYSYDLHSARSKSCVLRSSGCRSQFLFAPFKAHGSIICGGALVPEAHDFLPEVTLNLFNDQIDFRFVKL